MLNLDFEYLQSLSNDLKQYGNEPVKKFNKFILSANENVISNFLDKNNVKFSDDQIQDDLCDYVGSVLNFIFVKNDNLSDNYVQILGESFEDNVYLKFSDNNKNDFGYTSIAENLNKADKHINILTTSDNLTVRELKEKALRKILNNYLSTGRITDNELSLLSLLN